MSLLKLKAELQKSVGLLFHKSGNTKVLIFLDYFFLNNFHLIFLLIRKVKTPEIHIVLTYFGLNFGSVLTFGASMKPLNILKYYIFQENFETFSKRLYIQKRYRWANFQIIKMKYRFLQNTENVWKLKFFLSVLNKKNFIDFCLNLEKNGKISWCFFTEIPEEMKTCFPF